MANQYPEGKIHKLSVGAAQKPYYEVGTYNNIIDATIVEIIEDTNFLIETGVSKFLIVVENKSNKAIWVWAKPQGFEFLPQYAKPDGIPQNIE